MVGGDVDLGQKFEIPFVVHDRLVVLLGVMPAKMLSEVSGPCAHSVLALFGLAPLSFTASLLGGGVAMISTVRTGIICRP